jgi:hypothetical protein
LAKSTVVGKAKVISYKNIEEARRKYTTKEAAKEAAQETAPALAKRGRKRKSPTLVGEKAKKTRRSKIEIIEDKITVLGLANHYSIL